jgi:acyl-CoA synthetase (NDP forming)
MRPEQRKNLERLFAPRHVAVIGGRDAEVAIRECDRIGFDGEIWPVNPKRETLGGRACFANLEDLPEAPDAVYLAIPATAALDTVAKFSAMGAGGVVCYSAGFGEAGREGQNLETALVNAAGDMAIIGPNCYGFINYIDRVALWPFTHGGTSPGYGAAIITQSGMLSSDITMSQRSLPFAYMISAGNQASLGLEDFLEFMVGKPEVRAIGLHIEGLKNINRFSEAALEAARAGKPIIALKTGSSNIGSRLTVSHTGSLSGEDELYQALFDRLGVIRVGSPAQFVETLKFVCIAGVPQGNHVVGFTCSGGGATMLADHAESIGLEFVQPGPETTQALTNLLPDIATVSNPLDYTTPIWGNAERVEPVFETALADGCDAAVIVQDYPHPELDETKPHYFSDTRSFVKAVRAAKVPAAVCATLPENLDVETREFLVAAQVAPMQGIHEALNAIHSAAWYHERRIATLKAPPHPLLPPSAQQQEPNLETLTEWAGKRVIQNAGLAVPDGVIVDGADAPMAAHQLGFPVVLKMMGKELAHKTEAGAVCLDLEGEAAVAAAVEKMRKDVSRFNENAVTDQFLVERMVAKPVAELMISFRADPQFGLAMTLASGGVLIELIGDTETVLLPAYKADIMAALDRLKLARLLDGFRTSQKVNKDAIVNELFALAIYVQAHRESFVEIEINPVFIYPESLCAVDALIRVNA